MLKKYIIPFIVITALHSILQFISWSFAPGNTTFRQTNPLAGVSWSILSFPIFCILPKGLADSYFGVMAFLNSVTWGFLGAILTAFLKK